MTRPSSDPEGKPPLSSIRIKRGIRFSDAPAFKGKPRELVAKDYVYSITRSLDPNLRAGGD